MNSKQMHKEIKETNSSYMLLAQQMIREDRSNAASRLGISEEMATLIEGLSSEQILKMSSANMLLCSFHFDEQMLGRVIAGYSKDRLPSRQQLFSGHAIDTMAAQ